MRRLSENGVFGFEFLGCTMVLFGFFFFSCEKTVPKANIVAMVGKETLSIDEVMDDIPTQIRANLTSQEFRQYIVRWVNNQVLYQEAVKRKLHEGEELRQELAKLKTELLVSKLLEQDLDQDIPITDEEIQDYFEANKGEFALAEDRVHAYHISVKSRKEANSVRSKLRSGEAFQDIVSGFANDSLSLDWDLGYFGRTHIIPEIANVVFALKPGRYSQPIQSPYGYHVVKVVDKKNKGETMPLHMVADEIRMKVRKQKQQENYQRLLRQIKSGFQISTNYKLLDTVLLDSLVREGD